MPAFSQSAPSIFRFGKTVGNDNAPHERHLEIASMENGHSEQCQRKEKEFDGNAPAGTLSIMALAAPGNKPSMILAVHAMNRWFAGMMEIDIRCVPL